MANKKFESNAVFNGEVETTKLKVTSAGGDEGGEVLLGKPETNTTIAGTGVTVDVYQNKLRFFEQGGDARGYYLDITGGSAGVGTNIIGGGSASDSFKTISVTGQDNVVADSSTDTLSLVAGTNVSITTNATADSITINSTGNFTSVDSIKYPDYITFDTTPETSSEEIGTLSWDSDFETLKLQTNNVTLQIGQEHVIRVKNASGSVAIPDMSVVMFAGSTGDTITVSPAISTASYEPEMLVGITTEEIDADGFGFVTQFGFVNKVDTSDWELGDLLYSDPANSGQLTNVKPSAPNWTFPIAAVTRVHASTGRILVRAIPGQHLHDLVDVSIDTPADNEVLAYNSGSGVWINQTPSEAGLAALSGAVFTGNIELDVSRKLVFDGTTDEAYKTTLYIVDPTSDREILLPDAAGTIALTSDLSAYLTTSTASSTYLTQTDASSTYLTQSSASSTYLTQANATSNYQPLDQDLTDIASLSANGFLKKTAGVWAMDTSTYLTSYTETDPIFIASEAYNITSTDTGNWDLAYGWGDHSLGGYLTTSSASSTYLTQSNASSTYLTQSNASSTYLTQSNATANYQPLDQDLTDIAALTANGFLKKTAGVWAMDTSTYLTSESDTLSSVTGRGATTSTAITISNTTESTTPTSGALIVSGGLGVGKDVWIEGDLHVNGTTITENTQTVATHDNLIYLNAALDTTITNAVGDGTYVTYTADNTYTPGMDIRVTGMDPSGYNISSADGLTVYSATSTQFVVAKTTTGTFVSGGTAHAKEEANPDLGFAGGYYNAGYAHAGLFRDASDGIFKFFDGYTPEPDEAVNIDTTDISFSFAPVKVESLDVVDSSTTRTNLGLVIGTNVQAQSSTLDAVAGGTYSGDDSITTVGTISSGTWNGTVLGYAYGGTGLTTLGSAGQVLTVNSGATAIEWATPSGGGGGGLTTTTTSITANTSTVIESFAIATSRTAEAIIQITQGTDYYSSKVLLIHDGTNVKITEYAILESTTDSIPLTISAAINGSDLELLATITDAATTNATAKVVLIEVAV